MVKLKTKNHFAELILLLIVMSLMACNSPSIDKNQQIISQIEAMERAIEEKRIDDFMESLDSDISTARNWQKDDIERLIRLRLMRQSSVYIHSQLKELEWQDDGNEQARAVIVVAMAGTAFSLTDLARINADLMRFTITFKRDDAHYLISKADWQRARPIDFL